MTTSEEIKPDCLSSQIRCETLDRAAWAIEELGLIDDRSVRTEDHAVYNNTLRDAIAVVLALKYVGDVGHWTSKSRRYRLVVAVDDDVVNQVQTDTD